VDIVNRLPKMDFPCFDPWASLRTGKLSLNGKSLMISSDPPFFLSLAKGERRVFQQPANTRQER